MTNKPTFNRRLGRARKLLEATLEVLKTLGFEAQVSSGQLPGLVPIVGRALFTPIPKNNPDPAQITASCNTLVALLDETNRELGCDATGFANDCEEHGHILGYDVANKCPRCDADLPDHITKRRVACRTCKATTSAKFLGPGWIGTWHPPDPRFYCPRHVRFYQPG